MPGTEKGSQELREKHANWAAKKYRIKLDQEEFREEGEELLEMVLAEGLEDIASEIEVGDEIRVCRTTVENKTKLKSKLEKVEGDE